MMRPCWPLPPACAKVPRHEHGSATRPQLDRNPRLGAVVAARRRGAGDVGFDPVADRGAVPGCCLQAAACGRHAYASAIARGAAPVPARPGLVGPRSPNWKGGYARSRIPVAVPPGRSAGPTPCWSPLPAAERSTGVCRSAILRRCLPIVSAPRIPRAQWRRSSAPLAIRSPSSN